MSTTIYENGGVSITKFCGPRRDDDEPRTMYQINDARGSYVQLTVSQTVHLSEALIAELANRALEEITRERDALRAELNLLRAKLGDAEWSGNQ